MCAALIVSLIKKCQKVAIIVHSIDVVGSMRACACLEAVPLAVGGNRPRNHKRRTTIMEDGSDDDDDSGWLAMLVAES